MTEKERGDFDAVIMATNARMSGIDLEPDTLRWVSDRMAAAAERASHRIRGQIAKKP